MLAFQRQNLIICLVCRSSVQDGFFITVGGILSELGNLALHSFDRVFRERDFFSHDVNVLLQLLVFTDGVIEPDSLVGETEPERLPRNKVLVLLGFIGNFLLDLGLVFVEYLSLGLVLILQDQVSLLLVLQVLRVLVSFALQSLRFSFVQTADDMVFAIFTSSVHICLILRRYRF